MLHKLLGRLIEEVDNKNFPQIVALGEEYLSVIKRNGIPKGILFNYHFCLDIALSSLIFEERHREKIQKAREMYSELPIV